MPKNPRYLAHKRETIDSFLDFANGGDLPLWPIEVFLEVSNICDLKCAMCPTFSALSPYRLANLKRNERGLISIDEGVHRLDDILKHALKVHAFGYGEPTIHPQFKEIIQTLSEYEVTVDFFTHGMHLTQEVCEYLIDSGVVKITISFSGATKEAYENVYLGGDFERVLSGIKRLTDLKKKSGKKFPEIAINSLGFHHQIDTLPDFVRLMGEHGVNIIYLKALRTNGIRELRRHRSFMHPDREGIKIKEAKSLAKEFGITLSSGQYELSQAAALGIAKKLGEIEETGSEEELNALKLQAENEYVPIEDFKLIANSTGKKTELRQALDEYESSEKKPKQLLATDDWIQHEGVPCLEPLKTFYANYDGKVFTCCFRRTKNYIGHLDSHSGTEIWKGESYQKIQHQVMENRYLTEMCKNCIKKNAYPRDHGVKGTIQNYARWLMDTYQETFYKDLPSLLKTIPTNTQILENQKASKDRSNLSA